jgi:ribosomal protein L29
VSKYGYPAYHVKYIEHSPLAEVPEDWFAGFEVKLVAKRAAVEEAAAAAAMEMQKSTGQPEDNTKLLDYAKRAVVRLSTIQRQLRPKKQRRTPSGATDPEPNSSIPPKTNSANEPSSSEAL